MSRSVAFDAMFVLRWFIAGFLRYQANSVTYGALCLYMVEHHRMYSHVLSTFFAYNNSWHINSHKKSNRLRYVKCVRAYTIMARDGGTAVLAECVVCH